jgi:SAM-dependent methyltransferase
MKVSMKLGKLGMKLGRIGRTSKLQFVEDYRDYVHNLIRNYPLDKAMSLAIGGNFESFGKLQRDMLIFLGLKPQDYVIDIGCGAGRLPNALRSYLTGQYLGTDVVQELLDYARQHSQPHWELKLIERIEIPERKAVADMVCFFSVFSHLLHEESFCYLRESIRVLKPGGKVVFSFLDISAPGHWRVFEKMVNNPRGGAHLNMFLAHDMIKAWSEHLGLKLERLQGGETPWIPLSERIVHEEDGQVQEGLGTLGQSVAVLQKPK